MARHKVISFSVQIDPTNKFVDVFLETELKNPYRFQLNTDINYPTLQDIHDKLTEALDHCVAEHEKVEVGIFEDRFYVTINVKDFINTRFTGTKV